MRSFLIIRMLGRFINVVFLSFYIILLVINQSAFYPIKVLSLIEAQRDLYIESQNSIQNMDNLNYSHLNISTCLETKFFNVSNFVFFVGEKCNIDFLSKHPFFHSNPINQKYQLISLNENFRTKIDNSNLESQFEYFDTENTISKQGQIVILNQPKTINGIENCYINDQGQAHMLIELSILYKQKVKNELLDLNVNLGECFQDNQKIFNIIPSWQLDSEKQEHSIYMYKKFLKAIDTNNRSLEFHSLFPNSDCNSNSLLLELTEKSQQSLISDNLQYLIRISCLKKNNSKVKDIKDYVSLRKKVTIHHVIANIKLLRQKTESESEYILYIKIFIKTLIKSLKKKSLNKELSSKCLNKMTIWIKELCGLLQVELDSKLDIENDFLELENIIKMDLNEQNFVNNHSNTNEELSVFEEATTEDYANLEEILNRI